MSTTTDTFVVVGFMLATDDNDHYHCCKNHDISYCMKDISHIPYGDVPNPCAVCIERDRSNSKFCPLNLRCPE